jgi:hypothetical protein
MSSCDTKSYTQIDSGSGRHRARFLAVSVRCAAAGSADATTTVKPDTEHVAAFVAGFVAAEGTFVESGNPPKFRFAVGLGASDRISCETLLGFFDRGSLREYERRKAHYDDEVTFAIQGLRDHISSTIPFMDAHLPPSYKREQYLVWKAKLLDYWEHRAKRVRPCTVEGCDTPRRAHGLCRHHLYEQRGV